jgi:tetratricopeptide (TPR) repeat protein
MRATVLRDPALVRLAGRFVWLEVDTERERNAAFLERYPVQVWPTFLVVDPETERPVLKWLGTATAPDLARLLADGERAVKGGGGETPAALLARADRAWAAGEADEAVGLWRTALEKGGPRWGRRARVLESLALALQASRREQACADLARAEAPGMARGQSFANVVSVGLSCALSAEGAAWGPGAVAALEPLAREALAVPGVLADDRAGLYEGLVGALEARQDRDGARRAAEEWWSFLAAERARGRTPAERAMLDAWIVSAASALGDPARALPLLRSSERALPSDYSPPYRLAILHLELGQHAEALAACERALARAYGPRKLRVWNQLATVQEARGDAAAARRALEEAVAYAATLPPPQRNPRLVERMQARLARMSGD